MTFEALILACPLLTLGQITYIREHHTEFNVRAVACANLRLQEMQPKPPPLKTLDDVLEQPKKGTS